MLYLIVYNKAICITNNIYSFDVPHLWFLRKWMISTKFNRVSIKVLTRHSKNRNFPGSAVRRAKVNSRHQK